MGPLGRGLLGLVAELADLGLPLAAPLVRRSLLYFALLAERGVVGGE